MVNGIGTSTGNIKSKNSLFAQELPMNFLSNNVVFLLVFFAVGCRSVSDGQEDSLKAASSGDGVYELAGTDINLDANELKPIAASLARSKIIALGEGSHGTIEFSSIRTRLVKILVEDYGVRSIGFEMPWDSADPVEKYVQTCTGNPPYFWWGQTAELQKYLCDFNRRHPNDRVHVFGFDTNIYEGAIGQLKTFVSDLNDSQLNVVGPSLDVCKYSGNPPRAPSTAQLTRCITSLSAAIGRIDNNIQHFSSIVGRARVGEAQILFSTLKWMNQDMQNKDNQQPSINVRDAGMANLAIKWQQYLAPNRSMILWAENSHIQKKRSLCRMRTKLPAAQINSIRQALAQNPNAPIPPEIDVNTMTYSKFEEASMGEYLHDAMGSDYTAIATLGYDVNAKSVKPAANGTIDRTPVHTVADNGSIQAMIHGLYPAKTIYADFPNRVFDASKTQLETTAGAVDYWHHYKPREQYDGIFFLDKVNESP